MQATRYVTGMTLAFSQLPRVNDNASATNSNMPSNGLASWSLR